MSTKAQDILARVEQIASEGHSKKEAYEIVAKEFGMQPSSIRGATTIARRELGILGPRRVKETTTEGAVASAVETLERARDAIDEEVDHAKGRSEEAKREYDELRGSASDRKAEIESKIAALTA